jgi:NDP-sugar pyrophosphorylase family protein
LQNMGTFMQIVIPMSGFGERFRRAGYSIPKPLIEINCKPIIAHVIDMFPGEHDFLFICNLEHLNDKNYRMESILRQYCPTGQVVGIPPHKLGPVYAVQQVIHLIDENRPVVVNYCDFTCYWDWNHFKKFVSIVNCAGAIPAYKGFHPHSLGKTNYAYIREHNGWVQDIQEKTPYTDNRMNEYASSGTYYYLTGQLMKEAFSKIIDKDLNICGEYYVSLAYKLLIEDKLPVAVYPLQHFMQWGTPEDVAEYCGWSDVFKRYLQKEENTSPRGSVIVPMAGVGQRFTNEGYAQPKPLISVSGQPMVVQAVRDLPAAVKYVFVLREDMPGFDGICETLRREFPDPLLKAVHSLTEGQACTALLGLDEAEHALPLVEEPITVGACDHGALYDRNKLKALFDDFGTDVIVWGVRGHANAIRHPHMYGWVDEENGLIKSISVKMPLSTPVTDLIVLGTFTFRTAEIFHRCVDRMIARDGRVNGEFYLDTCINDALALGMCCRIFEVDHYISWGTPNDLRTFEYWQSCFHKWAGHPYELAQDMRIPVTEVAALEQRYDVLVPEWLASRT